MFFFFFKQKTAYEIYQCDWSSDVCSSDLRVFDGIIKKGDTLYFSAAAKQFTALDVGIFVPDKTPTGSISAGEIGYIVTGIKEPGIISVGDTVGAPRSTLKPLDGFTNPRPVVWASIYPESQDDLPDLRQALSRLRLSDSALSFEEESSGVLGRGFRCEIGRASCRERV